MTDFHIVSKTSRTEVDKTTLVNKRRDELKKKQMLDMTIYYKPNPWHSYHPRSKDKVVIFGTFTHPPWSKKEKCTYHHERKQWFYNLQRPFEQVVKFKFEINGHYQDTSALFFQYTDEMGNFNNIISPWNEIVDKTIYTEPDSPAKMLMLQKIIYSALKQQKIHFQAETKAIIQLAMSK